MDCPSEVLLTVGEQARYLLAGAGAVGYVWFFKVEGPESVVSCHFGPAVPAPPAEPGSLPMAGSVAQSVTLLGLSPGEVKLHIELRRPWDTINPPRLSHTFAVRVLDHGGRG